MSKSYLFNYIKLINVVFIFLVNSLFGQSSHSINLFLANENCEKGSAGINIDKLATTDTLFIKWSNGQTGVNSINELLSGNYSVNVIIKHFIDTTIAFKIEKEECTVIISNHFTPNSDNYNDYLQIANVINFPKFELLIFNKWGQKVHQQQENYSPWDGNWNGNAVPDETYYYVFYFNSENKNKFLKGHITLIR